MQEALLIPEIRPERFLDPSAGTGMFISTLKAVSYTHLYPVSSQVTGYVTNYFPIQNPMTTDDDYTT